MFEIEALLKEAEKPLQSLLLPTHTHTHSAPHTLDVSSLGLHLKQTYPDSQQSALFPAC